MKNLKVFLLEDIQTKKTEWGIGFGNPNPIKKNYFKCKNEKEAKRLYDLIILNK